MDSLVNDLAAVLIASPEPPCLSLYQPTHRHHPDNQQDPVRFGNLVKTLESSLRQKYTTRDVRPLLAPFHALAEKERFWNHTRDGLAVLSNPGTFRVYRLQRPVAELCVAADSFHLKPLLRIVQSADRYHVLALSRQEIRLYEGNRDVLDEIARSPAATEDSNEAPDPDQLPSPSVWDDVSRHAEATISLRQGSSEQVVDSATERFFRTVDRTVLDHYSRPSGLPLLLVALPQHHSLFRRVTRNPYLMSGTVDTDPIPLSIEALRARAWRVVEPAYLSRLAGLVEMFGSARSKDLGSDDLAHVAASAVVGRVATLLVEADRYVPGRIDPLTGNIQFDNLAHPDVDDLLDDVGEWVLRNRGQVVIVPAARMPTHTGLAALYRF
jgi:hypothetical protein